MAKKPSPSGEDGAEGPAGKDEVIALRNMSREDRLAFLMKDLDATCGGLPAKRRVLPPAAPKPRRKG